MGAELIAIFIVAIFIENVVLSQILGLCPFIGVSSKIDSATGMGFAVIFVLLLASVVTWSIQNFVLVPLQLEYLQTISFILIIASLVQFVEMVVRKTAPALYQSLGVFLPLITTNCAVLGISLINIKRGYNLVEAVANAAGAGIGFFFALLIMAGIRERLDICEIPESMKGAPIAFITAGLLATAFMGFSGLV
ncbi:MAG TPA: electron transport complex subunit RsxA [Candidatus Riflebacteria bacterium]|jgi:electron transport complex protein RnfA|nr:MAG: electron transport complex subunit RsxA [Candidatus Riflebacteria bacterium HGW-Riflebacteria-1]HAE37511.1 electron transport complex subunit RsxA [Candidatus Riflebacteria bacterium]